MESWHLEQIDHVVADGLRAGRMPGCVVMVGRRGKIVFLRAYGHRRVEPRPAPMKTDTVFDLASLTKPLATATSVMVLVDRGRLRLRDRVSRHLPEFGRNGKEPITVLQLLTHRGGLVADNPLKDYRGGREKAWERIVALRPVARPGSRFIYSDVGYIVLAELVRRVSGKDLHAFTASEVFGPLGMKETTFLPGERLRRRAAPTERRGGEWIQGQVHDPRAWRLGGVAGHAGLFSTAADLAVYASMILGRGTYGGVRVLSERAVEEMTRPRKSGGAAGAHTRRAGRPSGASRGRSGLRAAGWDVRTGYSTNRGQAMSPRAFGHGGFTGTSLWIDPELDLFVAFLSNRLHPRGRGEVNSLAGRIGTIAAAALRIPAQEAARRPAPGRSHPPARAPRVRTGLDVLKRQRFRALAGRRVGLITNHTGLDRTGASNVELLAAAPNVTLVKLFSPEHGFEGALDRSRIGDSRHAATGARIISLYGKTRRPTKAMLSDVDTLVFDIQDVGTRFYTYISTMGLAMEAAAEHNVRFVVLDRPNPINGVDVGGPVLDAGRESFVAFHRLPVRHGMTVGELARLFRAERKLDLDLHVVPMEGWRRSDFHDATGLRWVNPSPNMRSATEALLYPGIGLLEATNLSVGRGTATPFELVGAPWIDGEEFARGLNAAGLGGVRFRAVRFTPASSKFAGEACGGVRIRVTDRDALRPIRTGLEIARQLRARYRDEWNARGVDHLMRSRAALEALLSGKTVTEIEWTWQAGLAAFHERRARVLLYP